MSRIEEALRRAQLGEAEPDVELPPGRYSEVDIAVDMPPVPYLEVEPTPIDAMREQAFAPQAPSSVEAPVPAGPVPAPMPAPDPVGPKHVSEKLIVSAGANPVAVEQYRKVTAALHHLQTERGSKVVMVASAVAGEGKTLTAANVAFTLSHSFRRRTLLIDADLRRPSVHTLLNVMNVSGLNDVLDAPEDRRLTIVEVAPRLSVLTAGRPNPDPMSGLTSERMHSIIQEASAKFDWVVLDTPPIELLPDASLLAEMVDAVILVVGAGRTPFRSIERAVKAIDRKRIVGVVLNRAVHPHSRGYYGYGYYRTDSAAN